MDHHSQNNLSKNIINNMYEYTLNSLLDHPVRYSYSCYQGREFLREWFVHRKSYLDNLTQHQERYIKNLSFPKLPTILKNRYKNVLLDNQELCDFLLRKYEVTKRIYSEYSDFKPIEISGFHDPEYYVSTAFLLERFYSVTNDIKYLNCFLKLCDLFQSDERFISYSNYIKELILKESNHISKVLSNQKKIPQKGYCLLESKLKTYSQIQKINGLVLLCCDSSRSSIYLQALINANIYPEYIIYMRSKEKNTILNRYIYKPVDCKPDWLFIPKEYINPLEIANENNIKSIIINTDSVNTNSIYETLQAINIKLIIYSGFSGQIVGQKLLNNFNFLHCHPGTLPTFRGSTTFYYEILSNRLPSVSCILLDKNIDTGPILSIKSYPLPFKTDNIDTLYEPSIRANLLCDVIYDCGTSLNIKYNIQNLVSNSLYYYKIHTVLKHVCYSLFRDL